MSVTSHRWTSAQPLRRPDEDVQPGEVFEPTDAELRHFGDQIEKVDSDESDSSTGADQGEIDEAVGEAEDDGEDGVAFDADAWFDDHDGYEDRVATVESGDVDAILDEIEDAERSQNVIEAVEERRAQLEG